jgi:hypothetical protein
MAKAKSEKNPTAMSQVTNEGVEPMVIALAEQLGTFLGRVQAKAEGWLENDTLREQVGQIRDGALNVLKQVNRASEEARKAAARQMPKATAKPAAKKSNATGRSGGTVGAPGKRHRKPPPQESINKRMGEPVGKQAGQKQFKTGKSRGRM